MNRYKFIIIIALISIVSMPFIVRGKTSSEIEEEINQQKNALQSSQNDLLKLQEDIKNFQNVADNADGELAKLEADISKIDAELKAKSLEAEIARKNKDLKELEKKQREIDQNLNLKYSYMDWRSVNTNLNQMVDGNMDYQKIAEYSASLTGFQQRSIFTIAKDLQKLQEDIEIYGKKIKELEAASSDLQGKKRELEAQLAYFYGLKQEASTLGASIQNIQESISGLLVEQQQARQRENMILSQPPVAPNPPPANQPPAPTTGGIRFMSQGRDLYQGHGVGMSQWGAHGLGLNGYNYASIVGFYYTGVNLVGGYEGAVINVAGYGAMNIEDYVAGQGEVPGRACGTAEQVQARPDKYTIDNPNSIWDCWPEETIKAQAVAFRTYAIHYVTYKSSTICATAACQVYNGTGYTRWVADETRGQVLTYGGALIEALYSADNSQGWGTANNDTVFQNVVGDGTAYGYLRAVNDVGIGTPTSWTYWQARTNFYTYDSIKEMILYNANIGYYDAGASNIMRGVINDIGGTITNMTFERDPSNRVKKVWFTGPNGNWRSLGGWWFKNMWINWVYDHGTYDYIYSLTFFVENQ